MPVFSPVKSIGVFVDHLTPSQLLHVLIRSFEKVRREVVGLDMCLFARNRQPNEVVHGLPVLALSSAWSFPGVLISTSVSTTRTLDQTIRPHQEDRFFYAWDLEWTRQITQAESWFALYRSTKSNLVCRSQAHARVIGSCFNLPVQPDVVGQGEDTLLNIWKLSRHGRM